MSLFFTPTRHPSSWRSRLTAFSALVPFFRPGFSVPGDASGNYAPSDGEDSSANLSDPRLARSIRASLADGLFAEVMTACTSGAVLTAWALAFHANIFLIGLLGALPFLAQTVHLPAAWLTSGLGRRRVAIWASAVSRQVFVVLVPLPFLDLSTPAKQSVLVAVTLAHATFGVIGNNAWVGWMGDLIPEASRGRYFGRRHALATFGGAVSVFLAGVLLDYFQRSGSISVALSALAGAACVAGATTTFCLSRQHDPTPTPAREPLRLSSLSAPLLDPAARSFVVYQVVWNLGVPFAASFTLLHMIQNLKLGFVFISLHAASVAGCRILFAPLWGKLLDRIGPKTILVACSGGIVLLPLIWQLPTEDRLWPIAFDAVISGTLWGGHAVASFALPYSLAPRHGRAFFLAAFAASGGLFYAAGSVLGGALAQALPAKLIVLGHPMVNVQVLFAISFGLRLLAVRLAVRIVEPGSAPVSELFRAVFGGFNARLASVLTLVRR